MKKTFLRLQNVIPRIYQSPFKEPLFWQMNEGEVWTIAGRNGSGKTLFAQVICEHYNLVQGQIIYPFFEKLKEERKGEYLQLKQYVKTVSFNSVYSIADFRDMYYQQRFNSMETECSPCVADFFGADSVKDIVFAEEYVQIFNVLNIEKLMDRRLVQLSSGELRKLLIAKILLEKPRMIIFDNPFIGLDIQSRTQLDEAFYQLARKKDLQLLFLVPSANDMPKVTSHVLEMDDGRLIIERDPRLFGVEIEQGRFGYKNQLFVDWNNFPKTTAADYKIAVKMQNVEISYGKQVINKGINWEIKKGEKWALLGPNGSGKSTLLSYIFADNPQAYSKKLTLFDRKRGTGESIWDIKKRIGFTSSEMHLYYRENVSCLKVVESGFFDSIGLYRQCTPEQTKTALYLMRMLDIMQLKDRLFLSISSGEQRMILFARSLVKNPDMLILDEPFHGLDDENKSICLRMVQSYAEQPNKTLIFVTHQKEEIPEIIDHYLKL